MVEVKTKELNIEELKNKAFSLELQERQKYNYWCDRTAYNWNWTKEQDEQFQKDWDLLQDQIHALYDLINAVKKLEDLNVI